ncbi:MAG: geranylgeranyl reductase family protein [Bifidobacteriaceae bacterium]|nr:geranylgeranyl reductase family protein [Bifidobacteriaceae bacterium]
MTPPGPSLLGDADVIVVGAGPAGATAATYLADAGIDVLLLDKATFPREKVCGDGLTPRAVRELDLLGVPRDATWLKGRGLRVFGAGHRLELPWPDGGTYPSYSLTKPRAEFDTALLSRAREAGARVVEGATVVGPILSPAGRVIGVEVRPPMDDDAPTARASAPGPRRLRAGIVLAADGASARLAMAVGRARRAGRPLGVAARTYFTDPVGPDHVPYMESHLDVWDGPPGRSNLLPGYGWVFPLADGRLNVGLGTVRSASSHAPARPHAPTRARPHAPHSCQPPATASRTLPTANYRHMLTSWTANIPGRTLDPANQLTKPASAALPMGVDRGPAYADGLLILGDAAGLISPFNGEGIAHAMASGRLAAQAVLASHACRTRAGKEQALGDYGRGLAAEVGGYFTLGRLFVELMENPAVMRACTRYGLGRPTLMRFTMKLLSGLYEPRGGDWMDHIIQGLVRLAPAA